MIILYNTLLPNEGVQAIPADIGKKIKLSPVIDRVIEVDVAPIITIVSTDSKIVFRVLYFSNFFFSFLVFIFEVCDHFFNAVDTVIENVEIV